MLTTSATREDRARFIKQIFAHYRLHITYGFAPTCINRLFNSCPEIFEQLGSTFSNAVTARFHK
jgi:hypothetical protein